MSEYSGIRIWLVKTLDYDGKEIFAGHYQDEFLVIAKNPTEAIEKVKKICKDKDALCEVSLDGVLDG